MLQEVRIIRMKQKHTLQEVREMHMGIEGIEQMRQEIREIQEFVRQEIREIRQEFVRLQEQLQRVEATYDRLLPPIDRPRRWQACIQIHDEQTLDIEQNRELSAIGFER
ncbi:hypothetical protein O6H91_09G003000 [Diphasiastrum complanatum]|uniref:Uncharacterized protein n=1 Tax=Diphasiastrum complanatum TaxID=34168 RepID=A0ACC2CLK8_DIPCM|nr:hypothetical protein O6H91_09G003000 [Diphasiastrum complanatum]